MFLLLFCGGCATEPHEDITSTFENEKVAYEMNRLNDHQKNIDKISFKKITSHQPTLNHTPK